MSRMANSWLSKLSMAVAGTLAWPTPISMVFRRLLSSQTVSAHNTQFRTTTYSGPLPAAAQLQAGFLHLADTRRFYTPTALGDFPTRHPIVVWRLEASPM